MGASIEVRYDRREYAAILQALSNASQPDTQALAECMGEELAVISNQAFIDEADPVTGTK
jgi:ribosomal protein S7